MLQSGISDTKFHNGQSSVGPMWESIRYHFYQGQNPALGPTHQQVRLPIAPKLTGNILRIEK